MAQDDPGAETAALLERIRDARFSNGVRCPRCHGVAIAKWGSFKGRRRYCCRTCERTFSDLTGTPAVYTKKLSLWGRYARCLADGRSVRSAAGALGIAASTAFRWRHAIFDALRAHDRETLSGVVELANLWFAYSRKGERRPEEPGRTRGPRSRVMFPPRLVVRVIVASDRNGGVVTDVALTNIVALLDLMDALRSRIAQKPTLLASQGPLGPVGRLARVLSGEFIDVRGGVAFRPGTLWHLRTNLAYSRRLLAWIERFRGVATKYLPNYLIWHRIVDAAERNGPAAVVLRWALRSGFT
jgi:transposase-like protein